MKRMKIWTLLGKMIRSLSHQKMKIQKRMKIKTLLGQMIRSLSHRSENEDPKVDEDLDIIGQNDAQPYPSENDDKKQLHLWK